MIPGRSNWSVWIGSNDTRSFRFRDDGGPLDLNGRVVAFNLSVPGRATQLGQVEARLRVTTSTAFRNHGSFLLRGIRA